MCGVWGAAAGAAAGSGEWRIALALLLAAGGQSRAQHPLSTKSAPGDWGGLAACGPLYPGPTGPTSESV
jgi:hypothetical protein